MRRARNMPRNPSEEVSGQVQPEMGRNVGRGISSQANPQSAWRPGQRGGHHGQRPQMAPAWATASQPQLPPTWQQPDVTPKIQQQPIAQPEAPRAQSPRGPGPSPTIQASQSGGDLSSQMETLSVDKPKSLIKPSAMNRQICANKGAGALGRKVRIETNYLALDIKQIKENAYHYDVTIEPDKPKRLLKFAFSEFRKVNFGPIAIAFDGQKNAYSPVILDLSKPLTREVVVIDNETAQERKYLVAIKEVRDNVINLGCLKNYQNLRQFDVPMRAIQCIDIILKDTYHLSNGVQVGRSFFTYPTGKPYDLGDFYELWTGLFQSTVLGHIPYVNVDVAHKAFPSAMRIIDLIKGMYANSRNARGDINSPLDRNVGEQLQQHLRGLRIIYCLPGNEASEKGYKFLGLANVPAEEIFQSDGQNISVSDYFASRNCKLQYPNLPCLKVGSSLKSISLPIEWCRIPGGQAVMKKCTENQTRNMIREAATSTDIRKQKLIDILRKIDPNRSTTVQQFGLQVDTKFAEISARILDAPCLEYGSGRTAQPNLGVWRAENMPFITPMNATVWGVLVLDGRTQRNAVDDFCKAIIRYSASVGMNFSSNYFMENLTDRSGRSAPDAVMDSTLTQIRERNTQVLFCVIPDSGDTYARIKQAAELRCGVLTQCIKAGTMFRKGKDGSTVSNILLKVNAKLNGINHKLKTSPVLDGKCMFIGADVTHPSPDQSRIPSVVGVTASHDAFAFQYNMCWRLQDPRTEMIKDFKEIIAEQLIFYRKKNGRFPEKLLYYRDGVSEGQFQEVLNVELSAMYAACQSVQSGYEKAVKITMVVVQKRHHTRFFPGSSRIGDRKNNNVPAGTIVDTQITHPNETHFYLVSHQSIQGVAKPTKYCVLHDDSDIKIDELQALTYNLCHLFTRCNRSVSYPAPTYYAHLVAARGKSYIEGRNEVDMRKLDMEYKKRTIQEIILKGHPMYFV